MLSHSEINAQLEERGIKTYTVYATVDWTNRIVDHKTFVVPEALGVVADDFLFRAWDGDYQTDSTKFGQPQTCSVFAAPSDWKHEAQRLKLHDESLLNGLDDEMLHAFRMRSPIHYQHEITINGKPKREWRVRSERGILSAFSRLIESTQARRDGAPTPVFSEAPDDPILGPPRKVVGPYSD